jgi:hypothetical protein
MLENTEEQTLAIIQKKEKYCKHFEEVAKELSRSVKIQG